MSDPVKEHALSIGSQLAAIESNVARCMSMVMQAAIHGQSGVLDSAIKEADLIDDQVTALWGDLRRMRKAMRS